MPLYEYRCSECDHRFEVLQRLGEGAEGLTCPECGQATAKKQFSTFSSSGASGGAGPAALGGGGCGAGGGFT